MQRFLKALGMRQAEDATNGKRCQQQGFVLLGSSLRWRRPHPAPPVVEPVHVSRSTSKNTASLLKHFTNPSQPLIEPAHAIDRLCAFLQGKGALQNARPPLAQKAVALSPSPTICQSHTVIWQHGNLGASPSSRWVCDDESAAAHTL